MKKIILMAASAAMIFTACTGAEENLSTREDNVVAGKPAAISLTFELPGAATRVTSPATPSQENKVTTACIWLFDDAGNPVEVPTGGFATLTMTQVGVTDVWNSNEIETRSGNVRVYVGVNVPGAAAVADEAALLALKDEIADMSVVEGVGPAAPTIKPFTMMSEVEPTAIAVPASDTAPAQEIVIDVDRVASKVVTSASKQTYTPNDPATGEPWGTDGVTIKYDILDWDVFQDAYTSYLVKGTASTGERRTYQQVYDLENQGSVYFGSDYLNNVTANTRYIGENFSDDGLHGTTTYVMISTKFALNKTAVWDNVAGKVAWTGPANEADGGTDDDNMAIFFDEANGTVFISLAANAQLIANNTGLKFYTYPQSYVHFMVYLNKDDMNDYNIQRNEFTRLHIEGIDNTNGVTPLFPGYPGDPAKPNYPIDPQNPGNPNNPNPVDPTDPIDGAPAGITVKVTVNPWKLRTDNVTLTE